MFHLVMVKPVTGAIQMGRLALFLVEYATNQLPVCHGIGETLTSKASTVVTRSCKPLQMRQTMKEQI